MMGAGTGTGVETGTRMERDEWEEESFGIRYVMKDQALLFRTWHHPCRERVARAGSQQLRAQDPARVRRCHTEARTRTGTGMGTRTGRRVEGRESPGYYNTK